MLDNVPADRPPLLPERYPQHDLFICDISDAVPKDLLADMEHPFFSLSTKPDTAVRRYEHNGSWIRISPNVAGMPTIYDKDVLIYCISQVMAALKEDRPVSKTVRINSRDLLQFANRGTDGRSYDRLVEAIRRLRGVSIETNIRTGGEEQTRIFGLIEEAEVRRKYGLDGRLMSCEVTLSNWVMNAIQANEVLTLHRDYFRLRKPLERRLYEIARKHCGRQTSWEITLPLLLKKSGSGSALYKFRHMVRSLARTDHLPDYEIEYDSERDVVIFSNRGSLKPLVSKDGKGWEGQLDSSAYEDARDFAPGWDIYYLETQWRKWIAKEGIVPKNAEAHFLKFCFTWSKNHPSP